MRKKILVLVSLILLAGSCYGVTWLQQSSFTVFNTISVDKIENMKNSLTEKEELDFTALLCNEMRVPFDDDTNTFYIPLNMEDDTWEKLELFSGQPEYKIMLAEDITSYPKQEIIAKGKRFDLFVYDQSFWSNYGVVFSGLPIINLTTEEGFFSAEEITGQAVFYDVNFSLHGVKESEYNGHVRGNTSRMFPKKGYKLNLTCKEKDGTVVNNKLPVFGMREDDDWILLALYNDNSKIRDKLSMEIWDRIGAAAVSEKSYYGPKMMYVELVADNHYCGLYGLVEPVDAKQLDLTDEDYSYKRKNPSDLHQKTEVFANEKNPYAILEGFEIKDGVMKSDAWEAMAELSRFLSMPDEEKLKSDQDIINEDSALRLWLFLQIITGHDHTAKNVFYVAKYNDDLTNDYQFYFAPWDMDLTWGNVSVGEENPLYTGFEMKTYDDRIYWETGDWLINLNYHGSKEKVQSLYKELRSTVLTDEAVKELVYDLNDHIRRSGAYQRDEERWPQGAHTAGTTAITWYIEKRLNHLDLALEDFDYFEE